jgi:hypothetical protein
MAGMISLCQKSEKECWQPDKKGSRDRLLLSCRFRTRYATRSTLLQKQKAPHQESSTRFHFTFFSQFVKRGHQSVARMGAFRPLVGPVSAHKLVCQHPDFGSAQVKELPVAQAGHVERPHEPPRVKVLPEFAEASQRTVVGRCSFRRCSASTGFPTRTSWLARHKLRRASATCASPEPGSCVPSHPLAGSEPEGHSQWTHPVYHAWGRGARG